MQTIDLSTAQNVDVEYELASLQQRFVALLLDILVTIVTSMIIIFLLRAAFRGMFSTGMSSVFLSAIPLFLFIFYEFGAETFNNGQSVGKKVMNIQVVRIDGEPITMGDSLLRALFYLFDLLFSGGIVGALSIASSPNRQRLGDFAAGTTVIRLTSTVLFSLKDILSIDSIDEYEPQYPEVRQFSEQDMLFLKNVITRVRQNGNQAHQDVVNALAEKVAVKLDLPTVPSNKIEFFKTLIRDYIVLTR